LTNPWVVDAVDLLHQGGQSRILGHLHVEGVAQLFRYEDAAEDHKIAQNFLVCAGCREHLPAGVYLPPVPEAEGGEEPHVLVLFADEVMEEVRQAREPCVVDTGRDLSDELADEVDVEAKEVDRLPV